jgi:hypothetical protein
MSNKKTKNNDKSPINSTDSKLIKLIEDHINDKILDMFIISSFNLIFYKLKLICTSVKKIKLN